MNALNKWNDREHGLSYLYAPPPPPRATKRLFKICITV
jgi:hypothetical protein